jgi:hypothetical protein
VLIFDNTILFGYIEICRVKRLLLINTFFRFGLKRKKQVSLYTYKTLIFYKFICIGLQGVALKYEEEFHQALCSFARAQVYPRGDFTPGALPAFYSSLRESNVVDPD